MTSHDVTLFSRWPVTEAMISLIMAYKISGERKFLNDFSRVFDYAMVHVSHCSGNRLFKIRVYLFVTFRVALLNKPRPALPTSSSLSSSSLSPFPPPSNTLLQFREPGHGEWYGYADVEGRVTHTFKGGPQKGKQ